MAKKIETPGATQEQPQEVTAAQENLNTIEQSQQAVNGAKEAVQKIINDPNNDEDTKNAAKQKLLELEAAEQEVNQALDNAKKALDLIKVTAATKPVKNVDMSNITVNRQEGKVITGDNVKLTDKGYVLTPKGAK